MPRHKIQFCHHQSGFTLLELISSIAIVGVLSSTALAKFSDLGRDSRIAVLGSVSSSLHSAANITYLQAHLQGKPGVNQDKSIQYQGSRVLIQGGYPQADWNQSISRILDIDVAQHDSDPQKICQEFDFCGKGNLEATNALFAPISLAPGKMALIWMKGTRAIDQCYMYYHLPNDGTKPATGEITSGC
ncbi:MAG: type II secretion system protein [Bermanella sp.]